MKSIIFAVAIIALILAAAVRCEAAESGERRSEWSLQFSYSPWLFAGATLDEGDNGWFTFGPVHGGTISFERRGKGRWGLQVPVGFHTTMLDDEDNSRGIVFDVGANATLHFRKHDKKFDPYLILGGRVFVGTADGKPGVIPMANIGAGFRGYVSKHMGFFVEGICSTLIAFNVFEGRVGIAVRF